MYRQTDKRLRAAVRMVSLMVQGATGMLGFSASGTSLTRLEVSDELHPTGHRRAVLLDAVRIFHILQIGHTPICLGAG